MLISRVFVVPALAAVLLFFAPEIPAQTLEVLAGSRQLYALVHHCRSTSIDPLCSTVCANRTINTSAAVGTLRACLQHFVPSPESRTPNVPSLGLSVAPSSPDAINLTTLIGDIFQGVLGWVLDRARAEFQAYFLDRIRSGVCDPADAPYRPLVTHTCAFLGEANEVFRPTFGEGLKTAFERDIVALPGRLAQSPALAGPDYLKLRLALSVIHALYSQPSPTSMIATILGQADLSETNPVNAEVRQALGLVRAVSTQLTIQGELNADQRDQVVEVLARASAFSSRVDTHLADLHDLGEHLSAALDAFRLLNSARFSHARRREAIAPLASNLVAAFQAALNLPVQPPAQTHPLNVLRDALRHVAPVLGATATGNPARVLSTLLGEINSIARLPTESRQFFRVLQVGADLASARTPQEVSRVLDSYAAPLGSWRQQYEPRWTFSLAGNVSVGAGYERQLTGEGSPAGGLFSPMLAVGIGFSRGWGAGCPSFGVFVPIIDAGAMTRFGGVSSDDTNLQNSPLQFLAPGLYARLGLWGSPLVVSAGLSVIPFGQIERSTSGAETHVGTLRAQLLLGIELPIFNFSNY